MFPQLPAAVRVFLCTRPTDLRKGFDGLTGLVFATWLVFLGGATVALVAVLWFVETGRRRAAEEAAKAGHGGGGHH